MANAAQLKQQILNGEYDTALTHLYTAAALETQRGRYLKAIDSFLQHFGDNDQEVSLYSAPGRTEIGGNHTDHNHGIVFAAAVNLDMISVVRRTDNLVVHTKSEGFETLCVDLSCLTPCSEEAGSSAALIRGIAAGICERGGSIGGFEAYITSDVLGGSGLSSSAAYEVLIGEIINGEFNDHRFSAVENAKIGQYAENVFFQKPCGLMDQTACAVGSAMTIDFASPAQPIVKRVPFDLQKYGFHLCITDTKGSHADLTDDYAAIRREMEDVAAFFGKAVLREVSQQDFFNSIAAVRERLGDRAVLRAIHFFAECERAQQLYHAIEQDRFEDFLQLIIAGGHSSFEYNQNAYSIQSPNQQGVALGVALSQRVLSGHGAWRLQGGGFAGTIQAFVPDRLLNEYCRTMEQVFGEDACYILGVRAFGAVRVTADL